MTLMTMVVMLLIETVVIARKPTRERRVCLL